MEPLPDDAAEKAKRSSSETDLLYNEYDILEDRKLMRKVDLRLLPILTLLYLLSFLDRSNVGNAKIDGLTTDIGVSNPAYNTSLALYLIAYVTFEVPANIILKRLNPQVWLPTLTLVWGIVSLCQGFIGSQASLFGVRYPAYPSTIVLGATEAGLFPGVVYIFSVYYLRRERHWRVAVFFGGAALSGAFGGVLAYSIGLMDGVAGLHGWQWIFILEGLLTVIVSLVAYAWVPTWAERATFLSKDERARLRARLASDSDAGTNERFSWHGVRQAFTDPLVYGYCLLFHGFAFALYTLSLFTPTIIAELGFATWKAQLMTVPPNALAAAGIACGAYLAARTGRRAVFIIGSSAIAIVGYIILATTSTAGAQYVGVLLAALGVYTGNALLLSWPSENVSGQTKRAVAVALQITLGDLGAVTGVLVYRPAWAAHHYRKPHIVAAGYVALSSAAAGALWFWMARENSRRAAVLREADVHDTVSEEERIRLGDRDVRWRYTT